MIESPQASLKRKSKSRVFIIDDHPVVREGLTRLINQETDLAVCGEAAEARRALVDIGALKPDLTIIDITLPGMDGLELIKSLKARYPDLRVLVLSMHDETFFAERALRAGANGYVMKQVGTEVLIEAIRRVLAGDIFVSNYITKKIVRQFKAGAKGGISSPVELLSDRELAVFQLIGTGYNTRKIAEALSLSVKTIESYRANIKQKLQLESSADLLMYAVEWVQKHGII